MILVIDAYNVLKQVSPEIFIQEPQRTHFLHQVARYGKAKGHKMVVVFDGGPYDRPYKQQGKGIVIVYSGTQESADDYIRSYIEQTKTYELLLISSDRALCKWALQRGVESIDSVAFYAIIQQPGKKATKQENKKLVKRL